MGIEQDIEKAFYWYEKAAKNENRVAQYNWCFRNLCSTIGNFSIVRCKIFKLFLYVRFKKIHYIVHTYYCNYNKNDSMYV